MNVNRNAVLLFSAFVLNAPWAWAKSNTAIRAFNDGVKLFNAKEFGSAITHFNEAVSSDPEFAEAYFARGACKYYLKSMDGALLDLGEALRLKPDYTDARALRGAVNYETDHWDAALDDFTAVLGKNPHDAQSLLGRAVIRLKRDDAKGAARDFQGFLRVRPDDPLAPKIRQLLASLKGGAEERPKTEETSQTEQPEASAASSHHRSAAPSSLSAEELQKLADDLLSHPLSESYNHKILYGEKAQAVGDIHSVPGVPSDQKAPNTGVEIVEPR
jgi:tetratricopeptide (TPR) repeat protein